MDDFTAVFLDTGQPTRFTADIQYGQDGRAPHEPYRLEVNHPLELDGASVFLLGHGYAPVISYTDRYGVTQVSTTPFLADDAMLTSTAQRCSPTPTSTPKRVRPTRTPRSRSRAYSCRRFPTTRRSRRRFPRISTIRPHARGLPR